VLLFGSLDALADLFVSSDSVLYLLFEIGVWLPVLGAKVREDIATLGIPVFLATDAIGLVVRALALECGGKGASGRAFSREHIVPPFGRDFEGIRKVFPFR